MITEKTRFGMDKELQNVPGAWVDFLCFRVGQLIGFPFYSAMRMAYQWKNEKILVPVGFDRITAEGVVLEQSTAVEIPVPNYRVAYVNCETGEPITGRDAKASEIKDMLHNGVIEARRVSSGLVLGTVFNLTPSVDGDKTASDVFKKRITLNVYGIWQYREILNAVKKVSGIEDIDGPKAGEFQAISDMCAGMWKKMSGHYDTGKDGLDSYDELIVSIATLEVSAYLLRTYSDIQVKAKYGGTPGGLGSNLGGHLGDVYNYVRGEMAPMQADNREDWLTAAEAGHMVAGAVAGYMHDTDVPKREGAQDNFDVIGDVILESLADERLKLYMSTLIQSRLRDGGSSSGKRVEA